MKKNLLLLFFIITAICIFTYSQSVSNYKVHKVISPIEVYIDTNKNLVFDEQKPIILKDITYITRDSNLEKYPILKDLNNEEKLLIEYKTNELTKRSLNKKFVELKNNEIYVKNKKYSQILLDSNLVFNENTKTQENLINYIKSINTDNYVIYNERNRKYHKLNCENGIKTNKYKIIDFSNLPPNAIACKLCTKSEYISDKSIKEDNIEKYSTDNIEIFFQDINTIFKPSNQCNTATCKALKDEIDKSKNSIDFAIYGINNQPQIINALLNAQKRGVRIRWVCDFDKQNNNYYKDTQKLKAQIQSFNTDEEYEKTNSSAIMHNKFFIFDNQKVWTGSSNITSTDLTGFNANYSILVNSKELAQIYTNEFNQMYNGFFHTQKKANEKNIIQINTNTKIKALFSPQDEIITKEIIPHILAAKKSIYIPIFFITHNGLKDALINAHNNGVEIKVINDATNAHTKYSIHKKLRQAGIKVKTENYAGKMHMKAIFIDNEISILGSMNYTKSANNKNDENVLIIFNKEINNYLKQTFLHIWNKIPKKYEHFDPRAESLESIGSCFDGIDNNFDNKIDKYDEGCLMR